MATRLYFPSTGTPDVSPTINNGGEWEHSNGVRRPLVTTVGSSALSTDAYSPDAADHLTDGDALIYQYVLTDKLAAQTISGQTVKWQFQCLEAHANNNLFLTLKIFVCGNDGTIKETLLAIRRDATEVATSLTNRGDSATISSATVEDNDRIVVEIGLGGTMTGAGGVQGHNGSIRFGESASSGDLPEDDSTTTTTYRPWLEFANTLTLNQTVTQSSTFTNSASFYAGTVTPGAVNVTQSSTFTNSASFYAGTVSHVIPQASSFTNTNSFYAGTVTLGAALAIDAFLIVDGILKTTSISGAALYADRLVQIPVGGAGAITQSSSFTNSNTFYTHTVTPGAVAITQGSSFTNSNTLYAGTVSLTIPITQSSSFTNNATFYVHTVTPGSVAITQTSNFVNDNNFYAHTVSPGSVTVTQSSSFVNDNNFYAHTVSPGSVAITQSSSFTNDNSFYSHTVAPGSVTITQSSSFTNDATFYSHTVTPGNVTVTQDSSFTNDNSFYTGTIGTSSSTTQDSSFTNDNSFYAHTVTPGSVTVTQNSSFTNDNSFYSHTAAPGSVTVTQSSTFVNDNNFYAGTITTGGSLVTQDNTFVNDNSFYTGSLSINVSQDSTFANTNTFYAGTVSGQLIYELTAPAFDFTANSVGQYNWRQLNVATVTLTPTDVSLDQTNTPTSATEQFTAQTLTSRISATIGNAPTISYTANAMQNKINMELTSANLYSIPHTVEYIVDQIWELTAAALNLTGSAVQNRINITLTAASFNIQSAGDLELLQDGVPIAGRLRLLPQIGVGL